MVNLKQWLEALLLIKEIKIMDMLEDLIHVLNLNLSMFLK